MKCKLKSLHLEHFKGVKDKKYQFGDTTRISGMNRLGKTTIATAFYWLMSDRNYELTSNPNIRPDDEEESIPTVTAVLDIDGKEITLSKMQKCKTGKPDAKGISKITLTNTYGINDVPKTERDFKAYLEDMGLSFDKFLVCSHPSVFTDQKQADMRKMLFQMASEKTDYDIAAMSDDTADVAKLLIDYKFEEIEAMQKASKKKATEAVEAIPDQIIGLEKAKIDVDVAEQELAKAELQRQITEIDEKIKGAGSAVDELMQEEMQLQFELSGIMQTMNSELSNNRAQLDNKKYEASLRFNQIHNEIVSIEKQIERDKMLLNSEEGKKANLNQRWTDNKISFFDDSKWQFDESSTVCSLCGQTLPEDKIEQLKAEFETKKAKAKSDFDKKKADDKAKIDADVAELKNTIQRLNDDIISQAQKLETLKQQECAALAEQNQYTSQLAELPTEADYTSNSQYVELKDKHNKVKARIEACKTSDDITSQLKSEKNELEMKLDEVKSIIAQAENNVRIDDQIADMQEKQRDYAQAKADAENILNQLSIVSKKKNELLVEEINNHFGIVKWILFDYLKNGEYKEVCIPQVDNKRFGESTNTGREIEAKLDICNSFQKFFDMYVPVFLDSAESINSEYLPKLDTQLITLCVSQDKELKVEVI